MMKISYIKRADIDIRKWDACIHKSLNGIVYAYSWYLDIVCNDWDALVADNYVAVMPLPKSKKYGIQYILQPPLTQQLGVFSSGVLNAKIVADFLSNIPKQFRYIVLNLNTYNDIENGVFTKKENSNYELDLIQPYYLISKGYASNNKRNINKAVANEVFIGTRMKSAELINLFKNDVGEKIKPKEKEYEIINQIMLLAIKKGIGELIGVYSKQNDLIAGAFLISSKNRKILLFNASNSEGKNVGAMAFLIDTIISINSEKDLTLDFEGSNLEGLARFYKGFGAKLCKYLTIRRNTLPFLLRLIKS